MLYEKRIEDVLEDERYKSIEDEKLKPTTVFMPQLMRLGLSELREKHGVSIKYLIERVVRHGHSIIQHEFLDGINTIKNAKTELKYATLRPFRNFNEFKVDIDGMERPIKRFIQIREGIISSIRELSEVLGIEQSSFIRLCIYYSLETSNELHKEVLDIASKETQIFRERLEQNLYIYVGIVQLEKGWVKRNENL